MIDFLDQIDRQIFLFLNGLHADWLDPIMYTMTGAGAWWPLFVLVIIFLVRNYGLQTVLILLGIAVVITAADQISASLIKPLVGRLRPSHNESLEGLVHLVNGYRGGKFSFVSSHATNAMGIATFFWFSCRQKISWIWIMFIWAVLFSYTRIYLGVHYPGDILAGWLLGALIGFGIYKLMMMMPIAPKYSSFRS